MGSKSYLRKAVLVTIHSKSMSICNRSHARLVDSIAEIVRYWRERDIHAERQSDCQTDRHVIMITGNTISKLDGNIIMSSLTNSRADRPKLSTVSYWPARSEIIIIRDGTFHEIFSA